MAPKHGPRGKAPKKQIPIVPDSEHIVFTNNQSATKPKETKDTQPEIPRPDAKKIIGGASWTGKLPVNLLSEHCQRQKWNKPEYSMRRVPEGDGGGHRSAVTLSTTNPKTKEITTLPPFQLPASHSRLASQQTPLEARHFAAAYALFRISSMKNIHMTLPPQYRDLWKGDFALLKQEDLAAGNAWKYDADPFAADTERKRIHLSIEKEKAKKAEERSNLTSSNMQTPGRAGSQGLSKVWDRAPKAEMGNKIRADVEALVRNAAIWNPYEADMSAIERESIVKSLSHLGFRRSHVEEAVQYCKDREETLEWLLIHVPEDDLPPWSFPESYSAGVTLASGDLAKEGKLKRLALAGYSSDLCAKILQETGGDEGLAASNLQQTLVAEGGEKHTPQDEATEEDWVGEMTMLEAIFGERYSTPSPAVCCIRSEAETAPCMTLQFRRPRTGYPNHSPPIISVHTEKLPAYIRLSATRQALLFAQQNLLGSAMIFNLVEWLETNISRIMDDPGPLRNISQSPVSRSENPQRAITTGKLLTRSRNEGSRGHDERRSQELYDAWKVRKSIPAQQKMLNDRKNLPAWAMQGAIVDSINTHRCVIISGETGSGKSTQAVQFILDHLIETLHGSTANILCTQPRRISALGLADRVSNERCSSVGDEVGYVIRGDSKISRGRTKITFMTTGVLLRRLQSSSDVLESMADVTHIFVDEVHERGVDTDFLLALLREALKVRDDLKLILMSATLDAAIFSNYFGGSGEVGHVHISGRTFPVTDLYLDDVLKAINYSTDDSYTGVEQGDQQDQTIGRNIRSLGMGINYDLIAELVRCIDIELGPNEGGILIFLPGTFEIDRCLGALRGISNIYVLPLHASLMPAEQRRVFLPPPKGKRKVVAATNVAETSITIEDIVAVIDTGRVKETTFDPADNIVRLVEVWASQAAGKQRRGRAGRVRAGTCYKLFTRTIEAGMALRPEPEIRRIPLEQLCLSVKGTGVDRDVAQFLQQTLTPPEEGAIEVAMTLLHRIGALDNNQLTALGRHLAMIPADLRCAKLLVYGSIFACMEACLTITSILTTRSPFVSPREKREEAKAARLTFFHEHGDLLLDLVAYNEWWERSQSSNYRTVHEWCSTNFLSHQALRDISSTRSQLLSSLKDASILPVGYDRSPSQGNQFNSRNENKALLRAIIAGSLNPQIARIEFPDKKFASSIAGAVELDPEARTIKYFNQENGRVFVHPSSSLFDAQSYSASATYISYFSKMATSKTFIRDLTPFNAYALLLFGGPIALDTYGRGLVVDEWLRLRGWARIGVLVSRLRILLDDVLRKRIDQPDLMLGSDGVIDLVRRLVEFNGQDR